MRLCPTLWCPIGLIWAWFVASACAQSPPAASVPQATKTPVTPTTTALPTATLLPDVSIDPTPTSSPTTAALDVNATLKEVLYCQDPVPECKAGLEVSLGNPTVFIKSTDRVRRTGILAFSFHSLPNESMTLRGELQIKDSSNAPAAATCGAAPCSFAQATNAAESAAKRAVITMTDVPLTPTDKSPRWGHYVDEQSRTFPLFRVQITCTSCAESQPAYLDLVVLDCSEDEGLRSARCNR